MHRKSWAGAAVFLLMGAAIALVTGCGGGSNTSTAQSATTTVTLSDPATCGSSTGGPFSHVYVTVTDAQINASGTAGDSDASWIDLTPSLKSSPQQIDL